MIPVLIGLTSAVVFGAADFLGGFASRRLTPLVVTLTSAGTAALIMTVIVALTGGNLTADAVIWGGLGGAGAAISILLLYAALAIGPMSILSPITAVLCAVVPVIIGVAQGEDLTAIAWIAIVVCLVAIVLIAFIPGQEIVRPSVRGLAYAVGSGSFMGLYISAMSMAPADSGSIPLLTNRIVAIILLGIALLIVVLLARRRATGARQGSVFLVADDGAAPDAPTGMTWQRALLFAIVCGLCDSIANSAVLFGLRVGELSIMSVLIALYPAGTVILAAIVLRERLASIQWIGLALAVVAAAGLSTHRELTTMLGLG